MAITEWYTSKIPEDEHEAPFLVVHIPGIIVSNVSLNESKRLTRL